MAASFGLPFTNAQWKELERQARIYEYLMSSIPVPPHLLIPTSIDLNSDLAPRQSSFCTGQNLKFTNGADLEPGRCRRTDGKKWRCSRNVAPDQKYCERHMHGARPRSRKPVELQASRETNTNNKKRTRYNPAISAESPFPAIISDKNGVSSQFVSTVSPPYLQAPVFLENPIDKVTSCDASLAFASTFKEPRSLERMIKGETADEQWHCVVKQTDIGRETLNWNSFGNFSAGEDQQSNPCMFLSETPKGFIDAWSNGALNNTGSAVFSTGKLSPSSLYLSTEGVDWSDYEMGQIQMGLGPTEPDQNRECCAKYLALASASWTGATPGGPLAEVIQLGGGNSSA
ncbi:hypothetical protein MANES_05G190700v8 [Manihot esculenta]|uniref:Uncharacterized protein n=2 Tax=Manihot esculenta TaxID=3983 RepID=A0ACB7HQC3_MANES|nr:hypothetical protein MANES_05G190700v8 [Manihot esculenta]